MSATTIEVIVTVGGATSVLQLVGDPADVLFDLQVGRSVSEMLLELSRHRPSPTTQ